MLGLKEEHTHTHTQLELCVCVCYVWWPMANQREYIIIMRCVYIFDGRRKFRAIHTTTRQQEMLSLVNAPATKATRDQSKTEALRWGGIVWVGRAYI